MSETIELDADGATRRPRHPPERGMTEAASPVAVVDEDEADAPSGPTPEDALAEAQRVIQAREQERDAARDRAGRAEREAQRAHAGRAQDRGQALAAATEAAVSAQAQARQALRTAREAGDIDAEMAATEALTKATYRLEQTSEEVARAKAGGDPVSAAGATQAPQPQQGGVSSATQSWIDRHPRFNTDATYKATLMTTHYDLVKDGYAPDSPAYFRELDRVASTLEGGNTRRDAVADTRQQFTGARPSSGAATGGGSTVQTLLGPVTVGRRGGRITVQVPEHLKADFADGAKISGMDYGDYIYEQVRIAEERKAGGSGGLITEEGSNYR